MSAAYNEAAAKIASNGMLCHDAAEYVLWKRRRIAENRM